MSYLEELLSDFRKGAKIRRSGLPKPKNGEGYIYYKDGKIYNEFGREVEPNVGLWLSKDKWELYQEPIDKRWENYMFMICLSLRTSKLKQAIRKKLDILKTRKYKIVNNVYRHVEE